MFVTVSTSPSVLLNSLDASEYAKEALSNTDDAVEIWKAVCNGAYVALEDTPRLLPVLMQANRSESGQTQAFLTALKPFLREERRAKVDRAAQMAKMIHLAKVFLAAKEE